jgi:hypothetical protein
MEANPHEGELVDSNSGTWNIPQWAQPISKLKVNNIPGGAINLNVDGRQVVRSFFYQLAAPLRWARIFPRN